MDDVVPESTAASVTQDGDDEAVHQTAMDYAESWYTGDAAQMARVLHPEMAKRFVRRFPSGTIFLEEIGASKLTQWTFSGGGRRMPVEHQDHTVTVLDVYFRAAMSKVIAADGVEYLQLGKFGAEWKIVNILGEPHLGGPGAASLSLSSVGEMVHSTLVRDPRVEEAVRDYAEGWYTADASRVARMVHPQWSKKSVQGTLAGGFFLESVGADKMNGWTASRELQLDRQDKGLEEVRISVLDQHGAIAAARLAWDFDPRGQVGSVDYLSLARATVDDTWRAVNILWQDDRSHGDHLLGEAGSAGWIL